MNINELSKPRSKHPCEPFTVTVAYAGRMVHQNIIFWYAVHGARERGSMPVDEGGLEG